MDIHVHIHGLDCLMAEFREFVSQVYPKLDFIIAQGEQTQMALSAAETAIVARFNTATTAISDKIDALIANSANLDDAEFNAQLQTIADGLDALGQPATPVPGPGPQPTP